ncbi:hypothetical protein VB734_10050 [Synechococcus sp. BA-124 BA4]|uniref:hypothetical protein n=1 Tax=unclassified Synechococcus TaxID=2626047 RepID=UPI0018CD0E46|nr:MULTISPECIES: hypothetical protein [unclassified Synechococcus]MEA5400379.1 hypothetical protein [Synechococcus sp. BA-124 BA4]QPN56866.1 hypothetical protein I1E95_01360 [Synechococcus sp. CBW1107]
MEGVDEWVHAVPAPITSVNHVGRVEVHDGIAVRVSSRQVQQVDGPVIEMQPQCVLEGEHRQGQPGELGIHQQRAF